MSNTAWLLVGLVVLLLFGGRLLGYVRGLLRVVWPIALLLLAAWLITSGQAEQIINHIG